MSKSTAKMRHCWNCGAELGVLSRAQWEPGDTCGKTECEREARDQARAERDQAHEQLDRDLGWF
jgi:hypothetical protein